MLLGNFISNSIDEIAEAISEIEGVEIKELKSKSKVRALSKARKLIVWFVYVYTRHSLKSVAEYLNRSETSISRMVNEYYGDGEAVLEGYCDRIIHKLNVKC